MQFGGGSDPYAEFVRTTVDALLDMGFEQRQIVEALTYLKKQRNYSPVGELDKALDLIYREQANKNPGQSVVNAPVLKLGTKALNAEVRGPAAMEVD